MKGKLHIEAPIFFPTIIVKVTYVWTHNSIITKPHPFPTLMAIMIVSYPGYEAMVVSATRDRFLLQ